MTSLVTTFVCIICTFTKLTFRVSLYLISYLHILRESVNINNYLHMYIVSITPVHLRRGKYCIVCHTHIPEERYPLFSSYPSVDDRDQ